MNGMEVTRKSSRLRSLLTTMDCSGESIVTCIVLIPIFASLITQRLVYEFAGLFFLCVTALVVEYAISKHGRFKLFNPRMDTSAGIVIGAMCVPSTLVGRLIQQNRMSASWMDSDSLKDCRSEFWSAVVASVGLLIYILGTSYSKLSVFPKGDKRFGILMTVIIPSLAVLLSIKVPNVACLVLVSSWLLNYIVQAFPCCASLGEAVLVSNGVAVYSYNAAIKMFGKIGAVAPTTSHETNVSAVLQGTLIGLLFIPWLYKFFCISFTWLASFYGVHRSKACQNRSNAALFYVAVCLAFFIVTGWLQYVEGTDSFLLIWIVDFLLQDTQRLYLCGYWLCLVSMSALPFYMVKNTKLEQLMVRKVFHLMVVFMFVPALLSQQAFLHLAFSAALAVFIITEMIRIFQIPPFGENVHKFMTAFTDSRDSDLLIISHFSLLLGCALPLWLSGTSTYDRPLAPFAGIISLGIGDTMASVAGYNFGSIQLSNKSKKTLEGTVAGIVCMFLVCTIIHCMLVHSMPTMIEWTALLLAVTCTGLVEAYTTQLDNFILPLIFYTLLIL